MAVNINYKIITLLNKIIYSYIYIILALPKLIILFLYSFLLGYYN